jgi:copper transport protein
MLRLLQLWVLVAIAISGSAPPAHAHVNLIGSTPAANANLVVVPREIRLIFSQRPEVALTVMELRGPRGLVALDSVTAAAGNVVLARVAGSLHPGGYVVAWRTVSRDGHPVRGEFAFAIDSGAVGVAAVDTLQPPSLRPDALPSPAFADDTMAPLATLLRWITLVGVIIAVGCVAFITLIARRLERTMDPDVRQSYLPPLLNGADRLGLVASAGLVASGFLRLGTQAAVIGEGSVRALTTTWGTAWLLHMLGAVAAAAGFAAGRRGIGGGRILSVAGVLLATVGLAMSGHAMGVSSLAPVAVAGHVVHALAAAGWLGVLFVIAAVALPLSFRLERDDRWQVVADIVRVFSPTALAFAGVAVLAGVFIALLQLPSLGAVVGSEYGRVLMLKLVLVTLTGAAGAYNWLRVRPMLGELPGARRLRRSAAVELAFGALVLAVTAVLVATPMPAP